MNRYILVLIGTIFGVCRSQYISINPKPSKLNLCESPTSTTLLERFFDLVFTEFHSTPPACVCIQICADQPTYCYPNGCLRRPDRKTVEENTFMVNPVPKGNYEVTTKAAVDHRALVDELERPGILTSHRDTTEKQKKEVNNLIQRPNPFKELVLKYKKVPKLEMKYNLREQVKNTKSDKVNKEKNIDISKTRWPSNKHLLHGKAPFHRVPKFRKTDDLKQTKFFVSMIPDYDPLSYSPLYYKKYLAKRENSNGVNVEAIYLYQTDTSKFNLESLIDNLIESGLEKSKKDRKLSCDIELNDTMNYDVTTETAVNFTELNFLLDEESETNTIANNAAFSIISMNSTNENIDVNKYSHDANSTNQETVLEMIAKMTKEIEKQNKASIDFVERVAGIKNISNDVTTNSNLTFNVTATNLNVTESVEITNITNIPNEETTLENKNHVENVTTTENIALISQSFIYKKAPHRISRKLKRRKLNY